jgi:hypothetical protein
VWGQYAGRLWVMMCVGRDDKMEGEGVYALSNGGKVHIILIYIFD